MLQQAEKVFGKLIKKNRVLRFGCDKREDFCAKFKKELGGITPDILRDIENGNLVGTFGLPQMISMINLIWDSKKVRLSMLEIAYKVEERIVIQAESETVLVGVPVQASSRERIPPLPHRERL